MTLIVMGRRRGGNGFYEFLRPQYALPTGMSFNAVTGYVTGTVMTTDYVPAGTSVDVANVAQLNTALADAAAGTGPRRIRLTAGNAFDGQITLPANNTGLEIQLETSTRQGGTFLAENVRATPSDVALMPKMNMTTVNTPQIVFAAGARRYRFVGLHFRYAPGLTLFDDTSGFHNCQTGMISSYPETATLSDYVSDIVIDRCVFSGTVGKNTARPIRLNGVRIAVINCAFEHLLQLGNTDGQAWLITSGPGPYKCVNNHMPIGNKGQPLNIGGGDACGILPADIEVQRNHFEHPVAYQNGAYPIKNLGEMKVGVRALWQSNVFNGYFSTGQGAQFHTVVFKSVDQLGNSPAQQVRDLTFMHNEFRNCSGGVNLISRPEAFAAVEMQYVDFINNRQLASTSDRGAFRRGWSIFIGTGSGVQGAALRDVRLLHNTITANPDEYVTGIAWDEADVAGVYNEAIRHTYRNNLLALPAGSLATWPLRATGNNSTGSLNATLWNGIKGTTSTFTGNATTTSVTWPASNTTVASLVAADLNSSTYALNGTSPLKATGDGGRDPGAIHALIDSAISGVV